jgi:uridine phosphorylase
MEKFANYMKNLLVIELPIGLDLKDISGIADRYSMFKLGPILFANHGMGCPSLSILLNEIMKLIFYAGCKDVTFFRIGTSGGIGVEPGTVVLTEESIDGLLRPGYRLVFFDDLRSINLICQLIKTVY